MLANVLPGLRQLRAPLASGYLWLLAGYIALEPLAPSAANADGVWATLLKLHDEVGNVGIGVAVSFGAYLLGSISDALARAGISASRALASLCGYLREWLFALPTVLSVTSADLRSHVRAWRLSTRPAAWRRVTISSLPPRSARHDYSVTGALTLQALVEERVGLLDDALRQLGTTLPAVGVRDARFFNLGDTASPNHYDLMELARLTRHAIPDVNQVAEDAWREFLMSRADANEEMNAFELGRAASSIRSAIELSTVDRVIGEFPLLRVSLLGREPELFSAIDRLRSEAELRLGIALPLVALSAALAWRATWWAAALMVGAAIVLVVQGLVRHRASNDALIEVLRVERLAAPSLERIASLISQLLGASPNTR